MQVKVKVENIDWDTDGVPAEELGLTTSTEVTVDVDPDSLPPEKIHSDISAMTKCDADYLKDQVLDELSDSFGYCVGGDGYRVCDNGISIVAEPMPVASPST